jgi:hypothetical protein
MEGRLSMPIILAVLLLAVVLFALGFAGLHLLWWLAIIVLVVWLLGFLFRGPSRSRRWYRW